MRVEERNSLASALAALGEHHDDPAAVVSDLEREARQLRLQAAALVVDSDALLQIASGVRRLIGDDAPEPEPEPEPKAPAGSEAPPDDGPRGHPEGMEAVRQIMKQGGVWSPGQLLDEMTKRGWESKESKRPIRAVEAAVNRLWKVKEEIERVGRGQYRYRGVPPQESAELALAGEQEP